MAVSTILLLSILLHILNSSTTTTANIIATEPTQPLKPGDYNNTPPSPTTTTPNTVPAFPVTRKSPHNTCQLDLSNELFGGVNQACSKTHTLNRSRCCPVLAAWLFAAHARSALQISPSPTPSSDDSSLLPMMPDDSQHCVNSLQTSLLKRKIVLAQPNETCDTVLCFCGIRLHQITSLKCTAAFNVTPPVGGGRHRNATPTAVVKNLEKSCRNSSYSGCTKCLSALHKLKGDNNDNNTSKGTSRMNKMLNRDCQLMGLTWLLARNKTEYIPTVSAVIRALMYSSHPHDDSKCCSPDQENMPLAVDSLQFDKSPTDSDSDSDSSTAVGRPVMPLLSVVMLLLSCFIVGFSCT